MSPRAQPMLEPALNALRTDGGQFKELKIGLIPFPKNQRDRDFKTSTL